MYLYIYPIISHHIPITINKQIYPCMYKQIIHRFSIHILFLCIYAYLNQWWKDSRIFHAMSPFNHYISDPKKNNSFLELPSATSINSVLNEENEEHRFGIKGYPAVFICLPWKLLFSSTKQLDIRHLKYIYIVYWHMYCIIWHHVAYINISHYPTHSLIITLSIYIYTLFSQLHISNMFQYLLYIYTDLFYNCR